jgi:uncharacterized phosphosugar-binding protein
MNNSFFQLVKEIMNEVETQEANHIMHASEVISNAILDKHSVFIFGASHAGILTQEMFYRAGGLALFNPIFSEETMLNVEPITHTSKMEQLPGYGNLIAQRVPIQPNDVLIVHSVSGRNPVALDLVFSMKQLPVTVISITNLTYSKSAPSRHESGKRLFELSDIVIDNHGPIGDAVCKLEGLEQKVGATSTIIGSLILHQIEINVVASLISKGVKDPPVYFSANIDGGYEKNRKLITGFADQIHYRYE